MKRTESKNIEESIDPIRAESPKEITQYFETFDALLRNTNADWEKRVACLRQLQGLILGECYQKPLFNDLMLSLSEHLIAQVSDLRSAVQKEACKLISLASSKMGTAFEAVAQRLLKWDGILLLVGNGKKILADTAHECIEDIVRNVPNALYFNEFAKELNHKNAQVRVRVMQYISIMLQDYPDFLKEKSTPLFSEIFVKSTRDASQDVRAFARDAFLSFNAQFPEIAASIFNQLDSVTQKMLSKASNTLATSKTTPVSAATTKRRLADRSPTQLINSATPKVQRSNTQDPCATASAATMSTPQTTVHQPSKFQRSNQKQERSYGRSATTSITPPPSSSNGTSRSAANQTHQPKRSGFSSAKKPTNLPVGPPKRHSSYSKIHGKGNSNYSIDGSQSSQMDSKQQSVCASSSHNNSEVSKMDEVQYDQEDRLKEDEEYQQFEELISPTTRRRILHPRTPLGQFASSAAVQVNDFSIQDSLVLSVPPPPSREPSMTSSVQMLQSQLFSEQQQYPQLVVQQQEFSGLPNVQQLITQMPLSMITQDLLFRRFDDDDLLLLSNTSNSSGSNLDSPEIDRKFGMAAASEGGNKHVLLQNLNGEDIGMKRPRGLEVVDEEQQHASRSFGETQTNSKFLSVTHSQQHERQRRKSKQATDKRQAISATTPTAATVNLPHLVIQEDDALLLNDLSNENALHFDNQSSINALGIVAAPLRIEDQETSITSMLDQIDLQEATAVEQEEQYVSPRKIEEMELGGRKLQGFNRRDNHGKHAEPMSPEEEKTNFCERNAAVAIDQYFTLGTIFNATPVALQGLAEGRASNQVTEIHSQTAAAEPISSATRGNRNSHNAPLAIFPQLEQTQTSYRLPLDPRIVPSNHGNEQSLQLERQQQQQQQQVQTRSHGIPQRSNQQQIIKNKSEEAPVLASRQIEQLANVAPLNSLIPSEIMQPTITEPPYGENELRQNKPMLPTLKQSQSNPISFDDNLILEQATPIATTNNRKSPDAISPPKLSQTERRNNSNYCNPSQTIFGSSTNQESPKAQQETHNELQTQQQQLIDHPIQEQQSLQQSVPALNLHSQKIPCSSTKSNQQETHFRTKSANLNILNQNAVQPNAVYDMYTSRSDQPAQTASQAAALNVKELCTKLLIEGCEKIEESVRASIQVHQTAISQQIEAQKAEFMRFIETEQQKQLLQNQKNDNDAQAPPFQHDQQLITPTKNNKIVILDNFSCSQQLSQTLPNENHGSSQNLRSNTSEQQFTGIRSLRLSELAMQSVKQESASISQLSSPNWAISLGALQEINNILRQQQQSNSSSFDLSTLKSLIEATLKLLQNGDQPHPTILVEALICSNQLLRIYPEHLSLYAPQVVVIILKVIQNGMEHQTAIAKDILQVLIQVYPIKLVIDCFLHAIQVPDEQHESNTIALLGLEVLEQMLIPERIKLLTQHQAIKIVSIVFQNIKCYSEEERSIDSEEKAVKLSVSFAVLSAFIESKHHESCFQTIVSLARSEKEASWINFRFLCCIYGPSIETAIRNHANLSLARTSVSKTTQSINHHSSSQASYGLFNASISAAACHTTQSISGMPFSQQKVKDAGKIRTQLKNSSSFASTRKKGSISKQQLIEISRIINDYGTNEQFIQQSVNSLVAVLVAAVTEQVIEYNNHKSPQSRISAPQPLNDLRKLFKHETRFHLLSKASMKQCVQLFKLYQNGDQACQEVGEMLDNMQSSITGEQLAGYIWALIDGVRDSYNNQWVMVLLLQRLQLCIRHEQFRESISQEISSIDSELKAFLQTYQTVLSEESIKEIMQCKTLLAENTQTV